MKKSDLKQLIKPLVKECIHEVLIEEGLLSSVVTEVVQGLQKSVIIEAKQPMQPVPLKEQQSTEQKTAESRTKLEQHRRKMAHAIGKDAYNGVNLFEGVEPMRTSRPKQGSTDLGDPTDAGIDISSLIGASAQIWKEMK
jgi:hypothetical protein